MDRFQVKIKNKLTYSHTFPTATTVGALSNVYNICGADNKVCGADYAPDSEHMHGRERTRVGHTRTGHYRSSADTQSSAESAPATAAAATATAQS
jgi:hypothetical protein